MKKHIALLFLAASLSLAAGKQTFTGIVTDSGCANADHKAMNMGTDPQCVIGCVKEEGAAYMLYDGKKSYILSDQKTPERFAAKKVTVTGSLDYNTNIIQVSSITAAR